MKKLRFYDCYGIKFSRRTHTCREEDDADTTRYQIGNRTLAYFPDCGEDTIIGDQFIESTQEKVPIKAGIIYLEFES